MERLADSIKTIVFNCARCKQDHKKELTFKLFVNPVADSDGTIWNYWTKCPNSSEPILLKVSQKL